MKNPILKSRRCLTAVGLVLAVVAVIALFNVESRVVGSRSSIPNGGLIVDAADLNFGEEWEQSGFERTVRIKNPTSAPVHVTRLLTGCSCTSVEPREFVVEPGGVTSVRVTLDLSAPNAANFNAASVDKPREFQVGLFPNFAPDASARTEEWRIVGRVRSSVLFERNLIDFGEMSKVEKDPQTRTIRVRSLNLVESLSASCDPADGNVEVLPPANDSDWSTVRFTLSNNLPLGRFDSEVRLTPVASGGKALPELHLRVTGRVLDDVQIFPSELTLGAVKIGEPAEQTVQFHSLSGRPFVVQSAEGDSAGLAVSTIPQSKESSNCRLIVRAQNAGATSCSVRFKVVSDSKVYVVPLRISYVGLPEKETLSQQSTKPNAKHHLGT